MTSSEPKLKNIFILPTRKCNLKCRFCSTIHRNLMGNELSDEVWKSTIDEVSEENIESLHVTGNGEPLKRFNIVLYAIKTASNLDAYCEVETNGTLIDRQKAKLLVKYCDKIKIPIDGASANTHDYIKNKNGSFKKTLSAIKNIKNAEETVSIEINTVVCRQNYKDLKDIVELANQLGCKKINFHELEIFDVSSEITNSLKIDHIEREKLFEEIDKSKEFSESLNINVSFDHVNNELNKNVCECDLPNHTLAIDPHGNVGPCNICDRGIEGLNVKDNSLRNIFYGEEFSTIRKKMRSGELLDRCKFCRINQR